MSLSIASITQVFDEYEETVALYGTTVTLEGRVDLIDRLIHGPQEVETSLGLIEYVAAKDGAEGGGEDIWIVFKLDGKLYRLDGYYASYDGSNWGEGDIKEVIAEQKVITVYTAVKE